MIDKKKRPNKANDASPADTDAEKEIESVGEEDALSAFEQVATPKQAKKKKRLSSNTRLLITVTAVVCVLAIALALLLPLLGDNGENASSSSTASEGNEEVWPIYDRSKDSTNKKLVQAVSIKNAKDQYTIRYDTAKAVYKLVGYEEFSLSTGIDDLVNLAISLNGYDRVEKVNSLAAFGLDKPTATVDITYYDDTVTSLLIGNLTPDKAGYYVKLKDGNEVYMVDEGTVSYFGLTKGQCLDRTLIAAPSVKSEDTEGSAVLKEFTLIGGPNKETLKLRRALATDGIEYSYATFVVAKPYMRMVDQTVTESLESFTSLIAGEGTVLRPSAADKTKYGFDNPYAQLEITLAVETVVSSDESTDEDNTQLSYYNAITSKVIVGSKNESGNYYVMINDVDAIYLVSSESLSPLVERTYENTISELMFLKSISDIGKVQITIEGKAHEFLLKHNEAEEDADKQMTVTYNGKKLKTAPFRNIYSQLIGLARYGNVTTQPTTAPLHSVKLYTNNGAAYLTLDIYEYSASLYAVKTNEGELFTVKISEINEFISLVNDYVPQ